jgi:hypothetical protein
MDLSFTQEATSCASTQELPNILWNPKVHNHLQPPRFVLLHFVLPSGLFPSGLPTNNIYAVLFSPICAICSSHNILFYLIILIILGEEYKFKSSPLCSSLNPTSTSFPFGPNILLSTLFSNTFSLYSPLNARDQVSYLYWTTGKL